MTADLSDLRRLLDPGGPVLDFHTHPLAEFGPEAVRDAAEDAALLAAAARRSGVTRAVVMSLSPGCPQRPTIAQCRTANQYALRLRDARPDVFLPFCYVTPDFPEESAREVERCVAGERMVGVKLWVARRAADPGLDPIVQQTVDLGVPVLQHAWRKTVGQLPGESLPEDVAALAGRHPRARIVVAHLNGINPRGLEALRPHPNVLVDTAGGDPEGGMVALAVARLGAQRVVYGSDAPIRHQAVTLAKVLSAGLPPAAVRDVLWNNAARLLPAWADVRPV